MSPITFNKKSWHYRLATEYNKFDLLNSKDHNVCTYSKYVMYGAWVVFVIITGASVLLASQLDTALWIVVSTTSTYVSPSDLAMFGIAIDALILIVACAGLYYTYGEKINRSIHVAPPSFVKTWYTSFKEKTCFLVTFK